ncbi:MarR family winged helix-turn-helix transcriptional regulator [Streptomyces sp. x-80]|jgi:DNA-binding MarR family transcriptional regulator|uniref:MarR family winged helix-turn-helix transcriptional regulator n=1 Tax=Streptomyces sp. x-80 TaxID=2789282 RepID=UPI00397E93D7
MLDPSRPDAYDRDFTLFYFAYRAFTGAADEALAEHDMGRAHHRILTFLAYSPGMSVGELCDTLDLTKQAINGPLRRLIGEELVRVAAGARDRRRKELHLTSSGAALERALHARQRALFQAALEEAGPAAADGWRAVLASLAGPDWTAFTAPAANREPEAGHRAASGESPRSAHRTDPGARRAAP